METTDNTIGIGSVVAMVLEDMTQTPTRTRFSLAVGEADTVSLLTAAYVRCVAERRMDYDGAGMEARVAKVARWLTSADTKPMLLLYGGVGNGKTTMARAVSYVLEATRRRTKMCADSAPWLTVSSEDGVTRESWRRMGMTPPVTMETAQRLAELAKREDAGFERAKTAPFLIIDDLGCEPHSVKVYGTETTPITDILYVRYDRMLPTVVTTNLRIQDIRDIYGERVADRFNEVFERVAYTNKSYRRN